MMAQLMAQMRQLKLRAEEGRQPLHNISMNGGSLIQFNPKVNFSTFHGNDPRGWINKCNRYSCLCKINDNQKVDLTSLHLKGPAETWFTSYIMGRKGVSWDDFIVDVCRRFRDNFGGKVTEEFNRLQQDGTIDEYLAKFEELKALLLVRTPTMLASYFLESFIGGLKPVVKPLVRATNPQTVDMAIEQARFHEEHIVALKLPPDRPFKTALIHLTNFTKALLPTPTLYTKTPQNFPPRAPQNNPNTNRNPSLSVQRPLRFIPVAERAEKMAKGLCFFCDQTFERGHKCATNGKQLFLIEVLGKEEEEDLELVETFDGKLEFELEEAFPQISIYAMCGNSGFHAIRVNGHFEKKTRHILIDSGSTHNFLDEQLAKRMGCKLQRIEGQSFAIADGNMMHC